MEIKCLNNKNGAEFLDNGLTERYFTIPIWVPCNQETIKNYCSKWDLKKKQKSELKKQTSTVTTIPNAEKIPVSIVIIPILYSYALDVFMIIKLQRHKN